jgi:biotin operon repressor
MRIENHPEVLAAYFKTLADENRLRLIGYLAGHERNVGELAELLNLSEPTVSHHLARLRESGFVNLRAAANQRYYRLEPRTLAELGRVVADLEHIQVSGERPVSDNSWIDQLELDAEDRKVLMDYVENGRLKHIPTRYKKLQSVLRWLAMQFEADVIYTEREVNTILSRYHEDYARLRRELIEAGFLRRERDGTRYWLAQPGSASA